MIISNLDSNRIIGGFETLDKETHLSLLECFLHSGSIFLFAHFELNINSFITDISQADKDFYFNGFCSDYIEFRNDSSRLQVEIKIKDLLFQKYHQSYCSMNPNVNDKEIKNKLFEKFKDNCLSDIDEFTIQHIKDMICFELLNEKDYEAEKFIQDRTIMISHKNIFEDNLEKERSSIERIVWYKITNREDLRRAIEIERFYEFIVLNDNDNLNNYLYAVSYLETASNFSLVVKEGNNGDFVNDVFPKMLKVVPCIILQ